MNHIWDAIVNECISQHCYLTQEKLKSLSAKWKMSWIHWEPTNQHKDQPLLMETALLRSKLRFDIISLLS